MIYLLEEFVRNQSIFLRCKVSGIASWVSFEELGGKEFLVLTVKYWNVFCCFRVLSSCLSKTSSNKCWKYTNMFRKSSLSLKNSVASFFSRQFSVSKKVCSLFDVGCAWSNWAPCSVSVNVFLKSMHSFWRWKLVDFFGFPLALDRLANANTSFFLSGGLLLVVIVLPFY